METIHECAQEFFELLLGLASVERELGRTSIELYLAVVMGIRKPGSYTELSDSTRGAFRYSSVVVQNLCCDSFGEN